MVILWALPLQAQLMVKKGTTDVSAYFFLVDSTAGTPETGLTITGLDLQYVRYRVAPSTKADATALAATDSAHGDNQCIEIDATDQPGLYRCDFPDAAFATGVPSVVLTVVATGVHPAHLEYQLVDFDPQDVVRLGLTALPNAAADAAGGLPISDAGGLDLDARLDAAITSRLAPTVAGRTLDVTTAGEAGIDLDNTVGGLAKGTEITGFTDLSAAQVNTEMDTALVDARLDELLVADSDIDGAAPPTVGSVFHEALTKTAGSFTYDQTTDSPEAIRDNMGTPQTGDSFARLGAPAGASLSVDVAAIEGQTDDIGIAGAGLTAIDLPDQTMSITGNLSGSVGSVTAAVTVGAVNAAGLADFFDTNSGTTYGAAVAGSVVKEIADNAGGSALTEAGISDAVWDEILSGHLGAGSTGEALNAAGAAGDPWVTALPGAYGAGSAGFIIGTNLNATVTSRLAPTTAGRTLDVTTTGEAGIDLDNTAGTLAKTTDITGFNDLSAAQVNAEADQALADYDAATGTELAAVSTTIGVAGAGLTEAGGTGDHLTAITWNAAWDAQVESEVTDALNAYDPPTVAELVAEVDAVQVDIAVVEGQTDDIGVGGVGLTAIPSSDVVKNQALSNFVFLMVDATDHVTPETGLTVTGQLSCDAGAFAGVAGTIAEIGSGFYQFDAAAADTNCNLATWKFSASGADTYSVQFKTRQ